MGLVADDREQIHVDSECVQMGPRVGGTRSRDEVKRWRQSRGSEAEGGGVEKERSGKS